MRRRDFLGRLGVGAIAISPLAAVAASEAAPVRIGLTPVFLDDQVSFLNDWRRYLERRLQGPVEFVQRGSYREIVDLILEGRIHFAWLCGYPYVRHRPQIRLLAVPAYQGQPLYRSYLIVPVGDRLTDSIEALRGRVFAYSDPDSNSGFLYPQFQLRQLGLRSDSHFRRSFFTYSHRNVVEAVAARVAHGGAVDGYVWDTLKILHPDLAARTRVAHQSPPFGFPPMVASAAATPKAMKAMQSILLGMHADGEGSALLKRLNLDRFESGAPSLFDSIGKMVRAVAERS